MTLTRSNVAPEEAGEMPWAQLLRKGGGWRQVGGGGEGQGCFSSSRWKEGEEPGLQSPGFGPSMCKPPLPRVLTFHSGERTRV